MYSILLGSIIGPRVAGDLSVSNQNERNNSQTLVRERACGSSHLHQREEKKASTPAVMTHQPAIMRTARQRRKPKLTKGRKAEIEQRKERRRKRKTQILLFLIFIYFNWLMIGLQYWFDFCPTSTWISHRCTYFPSLMNLLPTSQILDGIVVRTWIKPNTSRCSIT